MQSVMALDTPAAEEQATVVAEPHARWTMLPSSPNWYCANISAWGALSEVCAIACKNSVALLHVPSRSFQGELVGHMNRIAALDMIQAGEQELCITGSVDCSVKVCSLHSTHASIDIVFTTPSTTIGLGLVKP
jgi:hypothetical protein